MKLRQRIGRCKVTSRPPCTILFRTNKIWGKNNQYNEEIAKRIKTAIQQNYTVHNKTHCIQTEVSVPGEKATSATAFTLRLQ